MQILCLLVMVLTIVGCKKSGQEPPPAERGEQHAAVSSPPQQPLKTLAELESDKQFFTSGELILQDQPFVRSRACNRFNTYKGPWMAARSNAPDLVDASLRCIYSMGLMKAPAVKQQVIYPLEAVLYAVESQKLLPKVMEIDRKQLTQVLIADLENMPF